MRIRHGGLVVDVPDEWEDRSTLLFVGPERRGRGATDATREALSVGFVFGESLDAERILSRQAEELRALDYELVASSEVRSRLGAGRLHEQRVKLGGVPVRQLVAAFVLGPVGIIATGSVAEGDFAACAPTLRAAIESLDAAEVPA